MSLWCIFRGTGCFIDYNGSGEEPVVLRSFPRMAVMATVRHLVSGVARTRRGSEQRRWGAFWWCRLHIAELHHQGVRKQECLTLMWLWMQDRQSCRSSASLVPLRKVGIDLWIGWEEEEEEGEAQTSIMVKRAAPVPVHLSSLPLLFFFRLGCVFVLVFEDGCISSLPTSLLSLLLPLHCSVLLLGCLAACSHTQTHMHTLIPPPLLPPSVSATIRHRDW